MAYNSQIGIICSDIVTLRINVVLVCLKAPGNGLTNATFMPAGYRNGNGIRNIVVCNIELNNGTFVVEARSVFGSSRFVQLC